MTDNARVVAEFPYEAFRRSLGAFLKIDTDYFVSVRLDAGLEEKQGLRPLAMISHPVGGGHEVFLASPLCPAPDGNEIPLEETVYHVPLSHMGRCLCKSAETVKVWIRGGEAPQVGVSVDDAGPAWEYAHAGFGGWAPHTDPGRGYDDGYLRDRIVTEISPAALQDFLKAVYTLGHTEEIFVLRRPAWVRDGGGRPARALLFTVPASGTSFLGLTAPYAGNPSPAYDVNGVEVIRVPCVLAVLIADSSLPLRIGFSSSEGVYVRVDHDRGTFRECLRYFRRYPYRDSLPPLDRVGEAILDFMLQKEEIFGRFDAAAARYLPKE
ncbi:hypothetical protein FGU65_01575 [Methanoculleus sp. FWC-SCC1]|uniref:Uncharacterized protein n=1 Tax=Methanoculleus frigidifontis TaxID=2584085 RepID=A0ABT8M6T5_9EURY|nr:hypothetical protein [Methanoculleus sp. FWC-SCC1]MDN7023599.1 hypothetical protein [Methanoculleus sp. FWC-SCC1]